MYHKAYIKDQATDNENLPENDLSKIIFLIIVKAMTQIQDAHLPERLNLCLHNAFERKEQS